MSANDSKPRGRNKEDEEEGPSSASKRIRLAGDQPKRSKKKVQLKKAIVQPTIQESTSTTSTTDETVSDSDTEKKLPRRRRLVKTVSYDNLNISNIESSALMFHTTSSDKGFNEECKAIEEYLNEQHLRAIRSRKEDCKPDKPRQHVAPFRKVLQPVPENVVDDFQQQTQAQSDIPMAMVVPTDTRPTRQRKYLLIPKDAGPSRNSLQAIRKRAELDKLQKSSQKQKNELTGHSSKDKGSGKSRHYVTDGQQPSTSGTSPTASIEDRRANRILKRILEDETDSDTDYNKLLEDLASHTDAEDEENQAPIDLSVPRVSKPETKTTGALSGPYDPESPPVASTSTEDTYGPANLSESSGTTVTDTPLNNEDDTSDTSIEEELVNEIAQPDGSQYKENDFESFVQTQTDVDVEPTSVYEPVCRVYDAESDTEIPQHVEPIVEIIHNPDMRTSPDRVHDSDPVMQDPSQTYLEPTVEIKDDLVMPSIKLPDLKPSTDFSLDSYIQPTNEEASVVPWYSVPDSRLYTQIPPQCYDHGHGEPTLPWQSIAASGDYAQIPPQRYPEPTVENVINEPGVSWSNVPDFNAFIQTSPQHYDYRVVNDDDDDDEPEMLTRSYSDSTDDGPLNERDLKSYAHNKSGYLASYVPEDDFEPMIKRPEGYNFKKDLDEVIEAFKKQNPFASDDELIDLRPSATSTPYPSHTAQDNTSSGYGSIPTGAMPTNGTEQPGASSDASDSKYRVLFSRRMKEKIHIFTDVIDGETKELNCTFKKNSPRQLKLKSVDTKVQRHGDVSKYTPSFSLDDEILLSEEFVEPPNEEESSSTSDVNDIAEDDGEDTIDTCGVTLKRSGYFTVPKLERLVNYKNENGECLVEGFRVGHVKYGQLEFPGVTNVTNMNLDEIVIFSHRTVSVYPNDLGKPPVDEGLNKRALITLHRVYPKYQHKLLKKIKILRSIDYSTNIKKKLATSNAHMVDYDYSNGTVRFVVRHF